MIRTPRTAPDLKPDYEFDGHIILGGYKKCLCDVRVWLPFGSDEDGFIEVTVMGRTLRDLDDEEPIEKLIAESPRFGFSFEVVEPFIRQASSSIERRLAGGIRLHITRSRSWIIRKNFQPEVDQTFFQLTLSSLKYGLPETDTQVDWRGNRKVRMICAPKLLRLKDAEKNIQSSWRLETHWDWRRDQNNWNISATASRLLKYLPRSQRQDAVIR